MALVERRVEREDRDFVFALAQLRRMNRRPDAPSPSSGPTRMLPLMSTRIARLTAEVWSDRIERIGRGSPLSRTSKSAVVSPFTGRPRASLTDAWMLTRSTELRNVAAACARVPGPGARPRRALSPRLP